MTAGDVLLAALLAVFGAACLVLALNPAWLDRYLRQRLRRDIDLVSQGPRSAYIRPATDPDRFLPQLRVMAGLGFLLAAGIGVVFVMSR